uniref:Uncharacterized protein n=1 Tax=Anguilla anguilla TaxID=7936 RepID=A0A0E9S4P7_ANGAN
MQIWKFPKGELADLGCGTTSPCLIPTRCNVACSQSMLSYNKTRLGYYDT